MEYIYDGEMENNAEIDTLYKLLIKRMDAVAPDKRNAETLAKAAYAGLQDYCDLTGMSRSEAMIRAPYEEAYDGEGNRWLVCLEAGPYEWAIPVSMRLPYGLAEPYYSFDLSFYPTEEYR